MKKTLLFLVLLLGINTLSQATDYWAWADTSFCMGDVVTLDDFGYIINNNSNSFILYDDTELHYWNGATETIINYEGSFTIGVDVLGHLEHGMDETFLVKIVLHEEANYNNTHVYWADISVSSPFITPGFNISKDSINYFDKQPTISMNGNNSCSSSNSVFSVDDVIVPKACNSDNIIDFSNLSQGVHTIEFTTSYNGCASSTKKDVIVYAEVELNIDSIICPSDSGLDLNAVSTHEGGYWLGNMVNNSTSKLDISTSGKNTIYYVKNDVHKQTDITIYPWPNKPEYTSLNPICADNNVSIRLTNTPFNTIDWFLNSHQLANHSDTLFVPNIQRYEQIQVRYTDTNNCQSKYTDIIVYALPDKPEFANLDPVCSGNDALVKLTNANLYTKSWFLDSIPLTNNSDTLSVLDIKNETQVKVRYNDVNNCQSEEDFTIQVDSSVADFTTSASLVKIGDKVSFTSNSINADSLIWTFNSGDVSTLENPFHYFYKTGKFDVTLTVKSKYGCTDTYTKTDAITVENGTTNLSHEIQINEVFIYPLPITNILNVELETEQNATLTIRSMVGATILQQSLNRRKNTIDVSNLQQGTYIISVQTKTGISSSTIIKN